MDDFLGQQGLLADGMADGWRKITPRGWERIEALRTTQSSSKAAFVAMAFHPALMRVFDHAIAPAIRAAGYEAIRIDRTEHNNRIDDEIIARIRQTKFLVSDFTDHRPGVYFEAGFALGLGHPVIWTVRSDQLDAVHFDNRQYNFIRWSPENLPEFATALQNRIEATIGKGTIRFETERRE